MVSGLGVLGLDVDPAGAFAVDALAVGEVVVAVDEVAVDEVALGEVAVMFGAAVVVLAALLGTAEVGVVCPGALALGVPPGGKGVAPVKTVDGIGVDGVEVDPDCCSVCASPV